MAKKPTLSFGLKVPPQARMVSVVRRFVEESFAKSVADADVVHRVALAVHELLENAAKYSVGRLAALQVRFEPDGPATIELTNETTPEHIGRLRACVGGIQAAAEPFAHYQRLMRETVGVEAESGLGLARIRAEGDLVLSLQVDGNMVTIVASG